MVVVEVEVKNVPIQEGAGLKHLITRMKIMHPTITTVQSTIKMMHLIIKVIQSTIRTTHPRVRGAEAPEGISLHGRNMSLQ